MAGAAKGAERTTSGKRFGSHLHKKGDLHAIVTGGRSNGKKLREYLTIRRKKTVTARLSKKNNKRKAEKRSEGAHASGDRPNTSKSLTGTGKTNQKEV